MVKGNERQYFVPRTLHVRSCFAFLSMKENFTLEQQQQQQVGALDGEILTN